MGPVGTGAPQTQQLHTFGHFTAQLSNYDDQQGWHIKELQKIYNIRCTSLLQRVCIGIDNPIFCAKTLTLIFSAQGDV